MSEQWATIRDQNKNKSNDKHKWAVKQSLLDACASHGFNSSTRAEAKPMSEATDVLRSFASPNSDAPYADGADDAVNSPEKPPQRKAARTGLGDKSPDLSHDATEDEADQVQSSIYTSAVAYKPIKCVCMLVCVLQVTEDVHTSAGHRAKTLFTSENEDNQPILQPDNSLMKEMNLDTEAGGSARVVDDMKVSDLDYTNLPPAREGPPSMQDMRKVRIQHFSTILPRDA